MNVTLACTIMLLTATVSLAVGSLTAGVARRLRAVALVVVRRQVPIFLPHVNFGRPLTP